MSRAVVLLVVAVAAGSAVVTTVEAVAQPPNAAPLTVPVLREWLGGIGSFVLREDARIAVADPALDGDAAVLAEDIEALTGRRLPTVAGPGTPGDIALRLGAVGLPTDGHVLDINPRQAVVAGPTPRAVFLGTRTLLQLIAQDSSLPVGTARDWPRYPERGLFLDLGRQYLAPAWIEQHIRDMAYLKMNVLQLHLNDDLGFRVESDTHPEVVSEQHLTKDEVRHLLAVAARYHVQVVAEIDMPGHMKAILDHHPELRLVDALGQPAPSALDITNPAARQLAREFIEEYLDLFPGPYWHGGGDEFIHPLNQVFLPGEAAYPQYPVLLTYAQAKYGPTANHKDAFLDFVVWMHDLVESHGRTLRVWADGLHSGSGAVVVPADVDVEWWQWHQATARASDLAAAGHRVLNAGWFPNYYSVASYSEITGQRDHQAAWDQWEVTEFWAIEDVATRGLTGSRDSLPPDSTANLGARLHVWFDEPGLETLDVTTANICPKMRLIAQKTWQSPTSESWEEFLARSRAVGRGPGFTLDVAPDCAPVRTAALAAASVASPGAGAVGAGAAGVGAEGGRLPATGNTTNLAVPLVLAATAVAGQVARRRLRRRE